MNHYAILVAISEYPGLTKLQGPEHDADDFRKWLTAEDGGNLPEGNVTVIKSSDYPAFVDRFSAHPAEADFKRALTRLLYEADGTTLREKVGGRLYLFFAGHGFTGKRLSEAALYTAQAARNDPDHIPSKRYAERIVNTNLFDEVILIMDCCRDVDLFDTIRDPDMRLPDRQGLAAGVRFMEAYGAGRGQQARERQLVPNGDIRGLFTYAFVDALRNADGNENGDVTGSRIKSHINDRWKSFFTGTAPYNLDIAPPTGTNDIVFARRSKPATNVEVTIRFNQPLPTSGSTISIQDGTSRKEIAKVPVDPSGTCITLADGLYKAILDGSLRTALIDASGQAVEVTI